MRVFVTGASGLIGQAAARQLLAEGHEVVGLTRSRSQANRLQRQGIEAVVGDLTHQHRLSEPLRGCQAVIHLAGSAPDELDEAQTLRLDYEGTKLLLESIPRGHLERFVFTSSVEVMGDHQGEWVTEALDAQPSTPHGVAKLRTEKLLLDAHALWRLPVAILRLGLVYGPGGFFGRMVDRLQAGELTLTKKLEDVQWGVLSVEDAARACIAAIPKARSGQIYLVADDKPQTLGTILDSTSSALGLPPPRRPNAFMALLKGKSMPLPSASARPRNEKFKRDMAFKFHHPSLREGLAEVMKPMPAAKAA